VLLVIAFFFWEAHIDEVDAAMYVPTSSFPLATVLMFRLRSPPSLWRYPNVPVLVAAALLPYFWWVTVFIQATAWFEGLVRVVRCGHRCSLVSRFISSTFPGFCILMYLQPPYWCFRFYRHQHHWVSPPLL
jgi:hypothetical protein